MILQKVRNECVRFGGNINIQVSYKILQLEVQKKPQFCTICLALKRDCFEVVLDSMRPLMFRG
jgi:multisubunit Na+/H+ antiporter MnhE subunit